MSLSVTDLQPGDRVMLNCPKARGNTHRVAQFEGLFQTADEAETRHDDDGEEMIALPLSPHRSAAFLATGNRFARFLLQSVTGPGTLRGLDGEPLPLPPFQGTTELLAVFVVEPDGGMREDAGRRVFVERRMRMGHG